MQTYICDRCGEKAVRLDKGLTYVYCGLCQMHLETGVIGYGLQKPRPGFVPPRWAHHLVR